MMIKKIRQTLDSKTSALAGLFLSLPVGIIFATVVFKIKPLENILKTFLTSDGSRPTMVGIFFMVAGFLALPFAFIICLWPLFGKDSKGRHHFYLVNFLLAIVIILLMIPTWGGIVMEMYRCEVLRIPNCD